MTVYNFFSSFQIFYHQTNLIVMERMVFDRYVKYQMSIRQINFQLYRGHATTGHAPISPLVLKLMLALLNDARISVLMTCLLPICLHMKRHKRHFWVD